MNTNKKTKDYHLVFGKESIHQKILNIIEENKIILDVGCASGYLGKEMKKKSNKVYGIESSKIAAEKAKEVIDDVIIGNVEEMTFPYPKNFFDVVVCADVLEHLVSPKETLTKLKNYLKKEGVLIASIPNIANWRIRKDLLFGRFEYQNTGLMDDGHLRFFTLDTAKRMFKDAGYEILKVDLTINFPLPLRYDIIVKLCKKLFPKLFGFQFLFVVRQESK